MDGPVSDPLDADYAEMAADAEREAEALEWIEGVLLDPEMEAAESAEIIP
jgi:hypothetical protein